MRQKLLLVAALFFGVLAFIFTHYQIKIERQKIQSLAADVALIRFNRNLTAGEKITADDISEFRTKRMRSSLQFDVPWSQRNNILEKELSLSVVAGDTLKWNYLKQFVSNTQKGLSGIISPGMRAVSISVDSTASVTGLVQPNNHVDIIGTFRFPEMKGDKAFDTITLTILQDVVILATGTEYQELGPSGQKHKGYSTVTLALTPGEVEMIIFATQKGRMDLSLRNYEDTQVINDLKSVNFKYLEDNIPKYTSERQKFMKEQSRQFLRSRD